MHDVLSLREFGQVRKTGFEPLRVGLLRRKRGLDFIVFDDAALRRINQEHQARLKASLAHNSRWVDVQDAGLRAEDDQTVICDPESSGAKAIAIKHRSDLRAIGETHVGGAIPRLHERRVELVESPTSRIHRRIVLPCLRNHHEDRVRERTSAKVKQFEDFVERC